MMLFVRICQFRGEKLWTWNRHSMSRPLLSAEVSPQRQKNCLSASLLSVRCSGRSSRRSACPFLTGVPRRCGWPTPGKNTSTPPSGFWRPTASWKVSSRKSSRSMPDGCGWESASPGPCRWCRWCCPFLFPCTPMWIWNWRKVARLLWRNCSLLCKN